MTLNQNQFGQIPIKGQLDLRFNSQTVSCVVDATSAGGLLPGQAVKIVDGTDGVPHVVECDVNTNDVFGFINYELKNVSFEVGMSVEVSFFRGNVMFMEASAAILKNAQVAIVVTGQKVVTATSGMRIVGRAFDKASASGDLIRVLIDLPGATV
jgi:hypothetical protein